MATVDDLKSIATAKLGFARPNQFLIELPPVPFLSNGAGDDFSFGLKELLPIPSIPGIIDAGTPGSREMNILCSNLNLPGKQVLTTERRVGMEFQKVAYGYASDDVNMTFYLMNDYGVKRYFDAWISSIINEETGTVAYKNTYQKSIKIHQLRKPQTGFSANLGPLRGSLQVGGGSVYTCELLEAFPTTVQAVELQNELDGLVQLSVQISYTRWKPITVGIQNFVEGGINIGQIFR